MSVYNEFLKVRSACTKCGKVISKGGMQAHQRRANCITVANRTSILAAGFVLFQAWDVAEDFRNWFYSSAAGMPMAKSINFRYVQDSYYRARWGRPSKTFSSWYVRPSYLTIISCEQLSLDERLELMSVPPENERYQTALTFAELIGVQSRE